jgi:hypothetical protein
MSHQAPRRGASAAKSFAARVYPEKDRWMEASGSLTPISGDQTPSSAISTLDLEMEALLYSITHVTGCPAVRSANRQLAYSTGTICTKRRALRWRQVFCTR